MKYQRKKGKTNLKGQIHSSENDRFIQIKIILELIALYLIILSFPFSFLVCSGSTPILASQVQTGQGIIVPLNKLMSKNGWCHRIATSSLGEGNSTENAQLTMIFTFPVPKVVQFIYFLFNSSQKRSSKNYILRGFWIHLLGD